MKIRQFKPGDSGNVVDLWKRCGLVVPHNDPYRDIARKSRVNPEWLLVGELDGEIIATCMAGYKGRRGWINYLAVSPDHRRCGYGRRITAEAELMLRETGCPKINLQFRSSNAAVRAFYRATGYRVDDCVSMGKRLVEDRRRE